MSRCILCNSSTDIEGGHLRMTFSKEEQGYICENCNYEIYSSIEELEERDREIALASEESRPEVGGGGTKQELPGGFNTLRQETSDLELPVQLLQNPSDTE